MSKARLYLYKVRDTLDLDKIIKDAQSGFLSKDYLLSAIDEIESKLRIIKEISNDSKRQAD